MKHPLVEGSPATRKNEVPQEHPEAVDVGIRHHESAGRKLTRCAK